MTSLKKMAAPAVCALLSSIAMSLSASGIDKKARFLDIFLKELNGIGLDKFIIFIALSLLFIKTWERFKSQSSLVTHLLSAMFGAFMLIGQSYASLGNWGFIFASRAQFAVAAVAFTGYFILFDVCITGVYSTLLSDKFKRLSTRPFPEKIERHYTLFVICVIMLCWLPYLLLSLPGSIYFDGFRQLNMVFGIEEFTNHHPWVLSKMYGALMQLGRCFSDNWGLFTVVSVQFLAQVVCYTAVCSKIKGWNAPFIVNVVTIAFFALLPPFGAYAQVLWKDGLFAALFVLFFALYIDICLAYVRKRTLKSPKKAFAVLFFVELAVCLTRNNGIHIVLPADILLFAFMIKGQRRYALTLTLCIALSYFCVENVIAPAVGVRPGGINEMLSIPFQQTARYLKEYPEDVTKEERSAIGSVLRVHDLAAKYNPELSDPVKNTYHAGRDKVKLAAYFKKAWFPMLYRHPGIYMEALFNSTFGYYYPFSNRKLRTPFFVGIDSNKHINKGYFNFHNIFPKGRNYIRSYSMVWCQIPGLAQAVNPGTYTWLLFILVGFLLYCRQYRRILALVSPLLNVAVCLSSPVNGYLRYALPLIVCMPVIFFWCTEHLFRDNETSYEMPIVKRSRMLRNAVIIAVLFAVCIALAYKVAYYEEKEDKRYHSSQMLLSRDAISYARIDVKNEGAGNDVEVLEISDPAAKVDAPKWMNQNGNWRMILSRKGELSFKLKCKGDGKLSVSLLGPDIRDGNNKRIPIWVQYTKFIVDDKVVFDGLKPACHDRRQTFTASVKDEQVLDVHVSWMPDCGTIGEGALNLNKEYEKTLNAKLKETINPKAVSNARLDIQASGSPSNDAEVIDISDKGAKVEAPVWMRKNGNGRMIRSNAGTLSFKVKCIGSGKLNINLRGEDVRDADGKRIPVRIQYSKLAVDGKVMFDGLKPVWHDRPYKFEMDVADGQIVDVQAEWVPEYAGIGKGVEKAVKTSAEKENEQIKSLMSELSKSNAEKSKMSAKLKKVSSSNKKLKRELDRIRSRFWYKVLHRLKLIG